MAGFGSFFGGLAKGAATGIELGQKQEELQLRKASAEADRRMKALTFLKEFRPMVEDAAGLEDPKLRTSALTDLFAGYQQQFGQDVSKDTIAWITKNPEQFNQVLKLTAGDGLRLDQVLPLLGNPMLRGTVVVALDKAKRTRTGRAALSDQPAAEGGAGGPAAAPGAAPADSPLTGPTPALEAQAQALEGQVAALRRRLKVVADAGNNQGVQIIQGQIDRNLERIAQIREKPALDAAGEERREGATVRTEGRQPISPTEADALRQELVERGRQDLAGRVMVGMPRTAAAAVRGLAETGFTAEPNASEADLPGIAEAARRSKVAPAAQATAPAAPGAPGRPQTPSERALAERTAAAAVETGQAGPRAAAAAAEQEAGKLRGKIREEAETARDAIPGRERVAAVLQNAGTTGAQIGPLRLGIARALQLVLPQETVDRLSKLSDLELLEQANIEFALAGLKAVGGNDTEKELMTMMRSNTGLLRSPVANRLSNEWALADLRRKRERDQRAEEWIAAREAEGRPPSLRSRDAGGMTFNQRWDRYVDQQPLYVRVARDLGLDPVEFAMQIGLPKEKAERFRQ